MYFTPQSFRLKRIQMYNREFEFEDFTTKFMGLSPTKYSCLLVLTYALRIAQCCGGCVTVMLSVVQCRPVQYSLVKLIVV